MGSEMCIRDRSVTALPDTHLVFVGAPEGKQSDVTKRLLDSRISERRLTVRGFKDREALKREFCEADLVLMPSRTEGFGLTALEAMSAGLPVIVSKNSGFGEALGRVPFGSSFVIESEDPSAWTAAINGTWNKDRRTRLDEIKVLRDAYGKRYSWSEQCKNLLDKMVSLLVNKQGTAFSVYIENWCCGRERQMWLTWVTSHFFISLYSDCKFCFLQKKYQNTSKQQCKLNCISTLIEDA